MKFSTPAKNIAVMATMAAILVMAKIVLSFVPNVEVITPLIIIFTCVFGFKRTIFSVIIFCLLDNFLYSFFYLTTLQYFFHWPLLCILSSVIYKIFKDNELAFALLAVFMGLMFWLETPVLYVIFHFGLFLPSVVSGIIFMVPMTLGGFLFTYLGYKPLYKILLKMRVKTI